MKDKLKQLIETAQKNEAKVNLSKIKADLQKAINKYFKDDKDLLEYVYVDSGTKKRYYDDGSDMNYVEVRAELSYDGMTKLGDYLTDTVLKKYDKYAYFDQETSGIMTAVVNESAQKNEATILRTGKNINGYPWTEEKLDEKAISILGVTLKYNIVKHHTDVPEDKRTAFDEDRIVYELANEDALNKLEQAIRKMIYSKLGTDKSGTTRYVGVPVQGTMK